MWINCPYLLQSKSPLNKICLLPSCQDFTNCQILQTKLKVIKYDSCDDLPWSSCPCLTFLDFHANQTCVYLFWIPVQTQLVSIFFLYSMQPKPMSTIFWIPYKPNPCLPFLDFHENQTYVYIFGTSMHASQTCIYFLDSRTN